MTGRHRRHPEWGVGQFDPDARPVTGAVPLPIPTDPEVLATLLGRRPDRRVDAMVDEIAGKTPEENEARAALYADVKVRAGGLPPRWGCVIIGHELLGWCGQCKGIVGAAELSAWRLVAAGHEAPDVAWARAVSAEITR